MGFRITSSPIDTAAIYAERRLRERVERAMMVATDRASKDGLRVIRERLPGRLGNAIGHFSDLKKGKVFREGSASSASGGIALRSKSERTVGAIISYTEGAQILPKKGRWLWIATDQIQRLAGSGRNRRRVTPAIYQSMGLDQKIGPLKLIRPRGRPPLLIVDNIGVTPGKSRSARSLTQRGLPRKGQVNVGIVAFYAIPRTQRTRVVDPAAVMRAEADKVPAYVADELRKNG